MFDGMIMPMTAAVRTVKLQVSDFAQQSVDVVSCASIVANVAADHLRTGERVVVSVAGVRGVSSSFFNVLLAGIGSALGSDFGGGRFDVETETETQRLVYKRSLAAYLKSVGLAS
jgi:hypothetical protein